MAIYESPHRVAATSRTSQAVCGPERRVAIAVSSRSSTRRPGAAPWPKAGQHMADQPPQGRVRDRGRAQLLCPPKRPTPRSPRRCGPDGGRGNPPRCSMRRLQRARGLPQPCEAARKHLIPFVWRPWRTAHADAPQNRRPTEPTPQRDGNGRSADAFGDEWSMSGPSHRCPDSIDPPVLQGTGRVLGMQLEQHLARLHPVSGPPEPSHPAEADTGSSLRARPAPRTPRGLADGPGIRRGHVHPTSPP